MTGVTPFCTGNTCVAMNGVRSLQGAGAARAKEEQAQGLCPDQAVAPWAGRLGTRRETSSRPFGTRCSHSRSQDVYDSLFKKIKDWYSILPLTAMSAGAERRLAPAPPSRPRPPELALPPGVLRAARTPRRGPAGERASVSNIFYYFYLFKGYFRKNLYFASNEHGCNPSPVCLWHAAVAVAVTHSSLSGGTSHRRGQGPCKGPYQAPRDFRPGEN